MPKRTSEALVASIAAKRARCAHLPRCRHCTVNAAACKDGSPRRRGLCNTCYNNLNIRGMYPAYKHRKSPQYNRTINSNGARPAFVWSDDRDLYPCRGCITEPVDRPLGLCVECQKNNPESEPRQRKQEPLVLCLKVHKVSLSREKRAQY